MKKLLPLSEHPVAIFDSGVGGLSVLRHVRSQMPQEHILYFADSGRAPYGDRPEDWIIDRTIAISRSLISEGAKAIVVACNTATVAAIHALRDRYPGMPIVGVEPGMKPAAAATKTGTVGVLATERTLQSEKFLRLRDRIASETGARFLLQPCVGLADQIETDGPASAATQAMLTRYLVPLLDQGADTIVLGCTHYPLAHAAITEVVKRHVVRDVTLIETGSAVAGRLAQLLAETQLARVRSTSPACLTAYTSASPGALARAFSNLLGIDNQPVFANSLA